MNRLRSLTVVFWLACLATCSAFGSVLTGMAYKPSGAVYNGLITFNARSTPYVVVDGVVAGTVVTTRATNGLFRVELREGTYLVSYENQAWRVAVPDDDLTYNWNTLVVPGSMAAVVPGAPFVRWRGSLAGSTPSNPGEADAYFDIDDDEFYIYVDGAWELVGGGGGGGGGGSGIYIDVTDPTYGADKTGATDTTEDVQSAIDAAGAEGGGTVFFPVGTYAVTNLTVGSNIRIKGEGGGSILKAIPTGKTSSGNNILRIAWNGVTQLTNIIIEDIVLCGAVATDDFSSSYQNSHSLVLNGVTDVKVQRVKFIQTRGDGIYLGSAWLPGVAHNTNVLITACTFDNSDQNEATYGFWPMRNGISVIDGQNVRIIGNDFYRVSAQTNQVSPHTPAQYWGVMPGPIDIEPNADEYTRNIVVSANTFRDCGGNGTITLALRATQITYPPTGFLISGNAILNCRGSAFLISDPTSPTGNTTDVIIANNIVDGMSRRSPTGDYGRPLYVWSVRGLKVIDNILRNTESSILLYSLSIDYDPTRISDIEFRGNTIESVGTLDPSGNAAIKSYLVNDLVIENNRIANIGGAAGWALWVRGIATNATLHIAPSNACLNGLVMKNNRLSGSSVDYLVYESNFGADVSTYKSKNFISGNTATDGAMATVSSTIPYTVDTGEKTYVTTFGGIDLSNLTSNGGITNTLASAFGANEFTAVTLLTLPTTSSATKTIWSVDSTYYPLMRAYLYGTTELRVMCATGLTDNRYARYQNFLGEFGGKTVQLAIVRNTSTDTIAIYVDGVPLSGITYVDSGTPPDFSTVNLTGTRHNLGFAHYDGASPYWYVGQIYRHAFFAGALTETQLSDLTKLWIPATLRWGTLGSTVGAIMDLDLSQEWGGKVFDRSSYHQYGKVTTDELEWLGNSASDNLVLSVTDFGAYGNGSTDELNSFRAAAAAMTNGSTLYIPTGSYLFTKDTLGSLRAPIELTGLSDIKIMMDGEMVTADYGTNDTTFWKTISTITYDTNTTNVTITFPAAHGFVPGTSLQLANCSPEYWGRHETWTAPTPTTIVYTPTIAPTVTNAVGGQAALSVFSRNFIKLTSCTNVTLFCNFRNLNPLPIYNQMDIGWIGIFAQDCFGVKGTINAIGLTYCSTTVPLVAPPDYVTTFPNRDWDVSIFFRNCGYGFNWQHMHNTRATLFGKLMHRGGFLASSKGVKINGEVTDIETSGLKLTCPSAPGRTNAESMENIEVNLSCSGFTFDDIRWSGDNQSPAIISYGNATGGTNTGGYSYWSNIKLNVKVVQDENTPCGITPVYMVMSENTNFINGLEINVDHDRSQQPWSTDYSAYTVLLSNAKGEERNISIDYRGSTVSGSPSRGMNINLPGLKDVLVLHHTDQNNEVLSDNIIAARLYLTDSVLDGLSAGVNLTGTTTNGIAGTLANGPLTNADFYVWTVIDTATLASGTRAFFALLNGETDFITSPLIWWDLINGGVRATVRESGSNYGQYSFSPMLVANSKHSLLCGRIGSEAVLWVDGQPWTGAYSVAAGSPTPTCFASSFAGTNITTYYTAPRTLKMYHMGLWRGTPTGAIARRLHEEGLSTDDLSAAEFVWDLQVGVGTTFPDLSGNNVTGRMTGSGVAHLVPGSLVRTTDAGVTGEMPTWQADGTVEWAPPPGAGSGDDVAANDGEDLSSPVNLKGGTGVGITVSNSTNATFAVTGNVLGLANATTNSSGVYRTDQSGDGYFAAEHVNIKDLGAVGNGSTDDTAAFKAAIAGYTAGAVVRTAGNDYTIYIPKGSYVISDTLVFTNGATMIGESATRSQLCFIGTNRPCIKVENATPNQAEYRFENFTMYRWGPETVGGTNEIAIQFKDCTGAYRPTLKNINIRRLTSGYEWYHGIVWDTGSAGPQSGTLENVYVSNVRGHSFASYDDMNAMSFISCYSATPDLDGFHWEESPNYTTFYNCANDTPGRYGYFFQNANTVSMIGCGVENAGVSGVYATNAYGLYLANCYIEQTIAASNNVHLIECGQTLLNSVRIAKTGGADGDYAIYVEDSDVYNRPQVFSMLGADTTTFTNGVFNVDLFNLSGRDPPVDNYVMTYDAANQRNTWSRAPTPEKPAFWFDSVWFDGTSTAKARTQPAWTIGTNDFTLWCRFRTGFLTRTNAQGLVAVGNDAVEGLSTNGCSLFTANDDLYASFQGTDVTNYVRLKVENVLTDFTNDTISVIFTRNYTNVALYVNGSVSTTSEETNGTPPTWDGEVDATYLTASLRTTLTPFLGEIVEWGLINKDLSAGEANILHYQGPTRELQYGSEVEISTGNLTPGYTYRIAAQNGEDFTTDGAASNDVGTEFIAAGTNVTLDANDKVVRVGQVSYCTVLNGVLRDVSLDAVPFGTNTVVKARLGGRSVVMITDTPTDNQIPKFHAATGTWTAEDDATAEGGESVGTVHAPDGTTTAGFLPQFKDTSGTNLTPSSLQVTLLTNLAAPGAITAHSGAFTNGVVANTGQFTTSLWSPYVDGGTGAFGNLNITNSGTFTVSVWSPYFRPVAGDAADAGVLRLANGDAIAWESSPAGTDVTMTAGSDEVVTISNGGFAVGTTNVVEAISGKQPGDSDLDDLADGSLTGSKVGSGIDDDNVSFDDADNLWTATTIGSALEELNDSINAGSPNGTGAKVHWSQLLGVPAGFADNTDDTAAGGETAGTVHAPDGTTTAGYLPQFKDTTGTNLTPSQIQVTLMTNLAVQGGLTAHSGAFTNGVTVPDTAYGAGWNGNSAAPSMNAVYDKIETLGGGSSHNVLSATHTDTAAASAVRGDIIVANSTPAWGRLAVGLFGAQVWSDATDVSWQVPVRMISWDDELISNHATIVGPWLQAYASSGTAGSGTGDASHPGVRTLTTGTATTGYSTLYSHGAAFLFGGGRIKLVIVLKTPAAASDGTDTYNICAGFNDTGSVGMGTDCALLWYNHAYNGGEWTLRTRSNTTETTNSVGVAFATSTWVTLGLDIAADGSAVVGSVNGTTITNTSNIPTSAGRETGLTISIDKDAGSTSRSMDVDLVSYRQLLTTTR